MKNSSQSVKSRHQREKKDILRWKGFKSDKLYVGPRLVNFHLTNVCNLTCRFCWYHSKRTTQKKWEKRFLDLKIFKKTIAECRRMGTERILFSGEGEPLLHPKFRQLVDCVAHAGLSLSVNTNATMIDRFPSSVLKRINNFNINISEVGSAAYSHMQSDDKSLFNKVVDNCRFVADIKRRYDHPQIKIFFILNRENFRHIRRVFDLALHLGADALFLKLASVNKATKHIALTRPFFADLKAEVCHLLKNPKLRRMETNTKTFGQFLLKARFFDACEDVHFDHGYFRTFYFDRFFKQGFQCPNGWYAALIDIRGYVFLCCNHQQFIVGNIHHNNFEDIWYSKAAQDARLKMKYDFNINDQLWRECHYCDREKSTTPVIICDG